MGQVASEINPVAAVTNGVKAVCHGMAVYVCNACKSECNFCGRWAFGFQTFEAQLDSDSNMVPRCGD